MRLGRVCCWVWLVALAGVACAQPRGEPRPTDSPVLFFTPRIVDLFINRITDEMSKLYGFDEEQLWSTREAIKNRFPAWVEQHQSQIIELTNEYLEYTMGDEPPTPAQVADWTQRARPLFDQGFALIDETAEEMRSFMTDEQQVLLDGQLAMFNVVRGHMQRRLDNWQGGGFDPESDWPRGTEFQRRERERQQQLEQEAMQAHDEAMGLTPEAAAHSTAAGGGGAVAAPKNARPASAPAVRKDEWTQYVENFIRRYQLDDAQQARARSYLDSAMQNRERYLRRKIDTINTLEQRLKTAKSDADRKQVQDELEKVQQPLERYFSELKNKLDTLPTRKQRAAAAESDLKRLGDSPASKTESDARPRADRPVGEKPVKP